MVDGQRADHDLHRPGNFLHRHLHAGRLSARRQAQQRIRAQIFPAGLVRHRVPALRRRAGSTASPASTNLDADPQRARTPAPARLAGLRRRRRRADVRRPRLQGFRRAVPDLGAGRLSGRARAGVGVPFRRSESRRVRDFPAHLHDRLRARSPIGWEPLVWIVALLYHDHRQLRRAHADRTSSACWPTAPSPTPATCWSR